MPASGRIDAGVTRGTPFRFTVDGEPVEAYPGETIATALLATGRRTARRTAHQGTPRGVFCAIGVCPMIVDGKQPRRAAVDDDAAVVATSRVMDSAPDRPAQLPTEPARPAARAGSERRPGHADRPPGRFSRRALLAGAVAVGAARALSAGGPGATTASPPVFDAPPPAPAPPLILDDASRLNATPVARHWRPTRVTGDAWLDGLRAELRAAAAEGRPVAVGAARHSMGGQAIPHGGVAMTLDVRPARGGAPVPSAGSDGAAPWIEPDRDARTYRVAAGARWSEIIRALDPLGFSPAVMQSNNDFGVAATLCVNAHGWPAPYGPFAVTVRSFRLMLASGDLVTCSPAEQTELFGLVAGGYGLIGVVTDLEVAMVENTLLQPTHELMPAAQVGPRLAAVAAGDGTIRMVYGRLAVDARRFLREALLVGYRLAPGPPPPAQSGGLVNAISREIFRAQVGSDTAKRARWYAETVAGPRASSGIASRNTLLNEPVASLAGRDRTRTDILHEYFLPAEGLEPFLAACRAAIPASRQDLLNVTLRYVEADRWSVLAYARGPRVAAVMLFSQPMTRTDEEDMTGLTRRLVDAALDAGGSFYLPYRLHARVDQLRRAYPRLDEFLDGKRRHDPGLRFRNLMWDHYFGA